MTACCVTQAPPLLDPTQGPAAGGGSMAGPTAEPVPAAAAPPGPGAGQAAGIEGGGAPGLAGAMDAQQQVIATLGQLAATLGQLAETMQGLVEALRAQQVVAGGGGAVQAPGCCCCCCVHGPAPDQAMAGAWGAGATATAGGPDAYPGWPAAVTSTGAAVPAATPIDTAAPPQGPGPLPAPGSSSHPNDVSTAGLTDVALQYLALAHQHDLWLVSGHRPGNVAGTSRPSDHASGKAIDVANGSRPTPEMQAYADRVRGMPGVKYVIYDNRIASERDDWAWRPYTHPSGQDSPTLRHEDHVHVSFH